MTKDNGGPAFPQHDLSGYGIGPAMSGVDPSDEYSGRYEVNGMSLRDWFAGQALAGTCAYSGEGSKLIDTNPKAIAKTAYIWADAMIAARNE